MKIGTAFKKVAIPFPVVVCLLFGFSATGNSETVVFGGGPGSLSWEDQFSEVTVIDFETNPGFIQPSQTGPEDNISLKLIEQGGTISSPNARVVLEVTSRELDNLLKNMVDDRARAFEIKIPSATGIIFRIDLGERFGVNRIRFFPREGFEEYFLKGYELSLNDGSEEQRTLSGTPDFRLFKMVERNVDPVVDLAVPLQYVRYIEVKQLVRGEWEIDEFQIFGEGFASAAQYTSKVFDQGVPAVFGDVTLASDAIGEPTRVGVALATRSGGSEDPTDSTTWSGWSPPYPSGIQTRITSPAPNQYWQFQLNFTSSDILSAATVDSIAVEVSPALADSLLGEIWPQNAMVGQNTELAYTVRSFNSRGFDRLEIETQAPVDVVSSVSVDGSEVEFEKSDIDGGVEIRFPSVSGNSTLRVLFESIALQYNTVFSGRVFNSQRPQDLPQVIRSGNAADDDLALGDDLSVTILIAKNIIHYLEAVPSPFTPNGDGVNELAAITYDIVNLTSGTPVAVEVYDLNGSLRRVIHSGLDASGRYRKTWDGTDDGGKMLPPGVYLVRVEVAADTGTESKTAIVPLVY